MVFLYTLGWVVPVFHHHDLALRSFADATLAAHTCGDVERHIPLDAFRGCEVCWQANQRVSLPALADTQVATVGVTGAVPTYRPVRTSQSAPLLPDKRGPPAVA